MQNHLFRTLFIVALALVAAFQIYPTIGWQGLSEDEQADRLEQWREEDYERLKEKPDFSERMANAARRWSQYDRDMVVNFGLDLQGGILMVIGFDMTPEAEERGLTEDVIQDIILRTVRNRANEYEAKEPIIQELGTNQVQVQLPGEKDIQRAKDLLITVAHLGFHMVAGPEETIGVIRAVDAHFDNGFVPYLELPSDRFGPFEVTQEHFELVRDIAAQAADVPGLLPEGLSFAFSGPPAPWETRGYRIYLMDTVEAMAGDDLTNAVARPDDSSPGNWMILFEFGPQGAEDFGKLTEENVGRQMAIVMDGKVVSAPNINERIFGSGQISGSFTQEESQDLSIALNSGSMPVTPREDYAAIVGPTLGQESVDRGVTSSLIGLALVMVFMLVYYRMTGLVANISLAMNALLILGAFAYFDVTLTLPGIAGLILTIGMAVDANVIIFERIREEQRSGKSIANCVESGFEHATSAILDANVTTLIAAAVLTQFGTGPVQGFAIALSIGICTSVFTALVVTRAQLDFIVERKLAKKLGMWSLVPADTKYDFLGKRRIAAIISVIAIVIGMVIFGSRGSDNLGVDFRTGTNAIVTLNSSGSIAAGDVRDALTTAGFDSPVVQDYEQAGSTLGENTFILRVGATGQEEADPSGSVSTDIQRALLPLTDNPSSASLGDEVELQNVQTVGPAVGAQLARDALNAVFFALIFIVLYLWFRFEWKFALGAVVALTHDVLIVTGLIAFFGREITIPVVAAILTIIGYSLNDTIVVFDRVREDLALNKARGLSFLENLNLSINRTLSRTLLTSVTTLVVVVVLFIYGGSAINDFAFALIGGVVVGTYSSIFVATPVVYAWQGWRDSRKAKTAEGGKGDGPRRRKPKTA